MFFSTERSSAETCCGGMRAILATISSISCLPITFFCFDFGRMRCAAPASSMTSIALSGKWRSVMYLAESSAALVIAVASGRLTTITQLNPAYVNFTFTDSELRSLQEIDKTAEELFDPAHVKVELQFGKDPAIRTLAEAVVAAQEKEIADMQAWLAAHPQ